MGGRGDGIELLGPVEGDEEDVFTGEGDEGVGYGGWGFREAFGDACRHFRG